MFKGEAKTVTAVEIVALLVHHLKTAASSFLNTTLEKAVVTVPSFFFSSQRQAVKDACSIAGVEITGVLNSTTAAAITLCNRRLAATESTLSQPKAEHTMLICDLGARSCDMAVITVRGGVHLTVDCVASDKTLGGSRITDLLAEEFKESFTDKAAINILRDVCERAKRTLCNYSMAPLEVHQLAFYSNISRDRFDEICSASLNVLDLVKRAMRPNTKEIPVAELVLVGGSSRVPIVQRLLLDCFRGNELIMSNSLNPEEDAVIGAAIQAAKLSSTIDSLPISFIAPYNVGFEWEGGALSCVFGKNVKQPPGQWREIDYTPAIMMIESDEHDSNRTPFTISCSTKGAKIQVRADLDTDGIYSISAVEKGTKTPCTVVNQSQLSAEKLAEMKIAIASYLRND